MMKRDMRNFLYYPEVRSKEDLTQILARISWFFAFSTEVEFLIIADNKSLKDFSFQITDDLDPMITKLFERVASRIHLLRPEEIETIDPNAFPVTDVLVWDKEKSDGLAEQDYLKNICQKKMTIWQVDPNSIAQEGNIYIDIFNEYHMQSHSAEAESALKFLDFFKSEGQYENALIIASGPSSSHWAQQSKEERFVIVCNSVIKNADLMRHFQPQALVFGDPIFHFGPSSYAANFRDQLMKSAHNFSYKIFMPLKFYNFFLAHFPDLKDRVIGIPFSQDVDWNLSLFDNFQVKTTKNILTFLMMPIATTFAKNVSLLGCDGRPISQDDYFWSHEKSVQFNDKMEGIKRVHPAFFKIDYNDYYTQHCESLRQQIEFAEAHGFTFNCSAYSHIPALQKRMKHSRKADKHYIHQTFDGLTILRCEELAGHSFDALARVYSLFQQKGTFKRCTDIGTSLITSTENVPKLIDCKLDSTNVFIEKLFDNIDNKTPHLLVVPKITLESARALPQLLCRMPQLYIIANISGISPQRELSDHSSQEITNFFRWCDSASPRMNFVTDSTATQHEISICSGFVVESIADKSPNGITLDEKLSGVLENFLEIVPSHPKVLVVDLSGPRERTATAAVRNTLFKRWRNQDAAIVHPAKSATSNNFFDISYLSGERMGVGLSTQEIVEFSKRFNPEVIYFRTFPDYRIASLVSELKRQTKTPLVMHFMDDWLSLLENNDAKKFIQLYTVFKKLTKGSKLLSISDELSNAVRNRFGLASDTVSNGVDPGLYAPNLQLVRHPEKFRLSYFGSLDKQMTFKSILAVARSTPLVKTEIELEFSIYPSKDYVEHAKEIKLECPWIKIKDQVPADTYHQEIQTEADALLIAYNFDPDTESYCQFSVSNKLPEYVFADKKILAIGPKHFSTIKLAQKAGVKNIVDTDDINEISTALLHLIEEQNEHDVRAQSLYRQEYCEQTQCKRFFMHLGSSSSHIYMR